MHDGGVGQGEQAVERRLEVGEIGMTRGARAADRAVEQHVAGEDIGPLDEEGQVAASVARGRHRLDRQARQLELLTLVERALDGARVLAVLADQLDRPRARSHRHAVAVLDLVELVDVVDVVVCQEDALDREVVLLDEAVQVVMGAVAVDPDRRAARLLGDDVRVGHPLGVLGVVDQHGEPPTRSGW